MSVLPNNRAAPTVVDPRGDEIDVLTDTLVFEQRASRSEETVIGESHVPALQEQVIVLDANRPIRRETIFKTDADRTTPASLIQTVRSKNVTDRSQHIVAIAGYRCAALHVEQSVVPGISDLAGD